MANPGTTCIVSGDIETPGSASATGGQVEFHLSSWDTDGTQTITTEPQIVQVSADGTISVPLWRNARGQRNTFYTVLFRRPDSIRRPLTMGQIRTPDADSADLQDLLADFIATEPLTPTLIAQAEAAALQASDAAAAAAADAAATAADRAQTGLDSASASASAANALSSETTALQAAIAAGAQIVTALTAPVPADGTVEILQDDAGLRIYTVVAGAWVAGDFVTPPSFDTVKQLLDSTATTFGGAGTIVEAGGFRYEEAESGAVDQHVTTAGGVKLYVLADADGANIKAFGAVGDGVTDDTVAIQAAIDASYAAFQSDGIPRTIFYLAGVYICRLVYLKPGVNHVGSKGAVIRKTPAGGEPETVTKWWRVFTTIGSDWNTQSECEHRVLIEGLIFDGNLANMGWTNNSYNQEQAHCLFLTGPSAGASAEHRAKFHVRNCYFQNNAADGLSLYVNIDVIAESIEGNNCFRGGITATGGNSKFIIRGYKGENARMDVEVDGVGYGDSYTSDFNIDGVEIDTNGGGLRPGGMDIGGARGGQFVMNNARVYTGPFNYSGTTNDPIKLITNCYFTLNGATASSNRFAFASNARFVGCTFNVIYQSGVSIYAALSIYPSTVTNATMEFERCKFILDDSVKTNDPSALCYAFYPQASYASGSSDNGNTKYILRDCESIGDWDRDISIQQGGTVEVIGGSWSGASFSFIVSTSGRPAQLKLIGPISLKPSVTQLFVPVAQATQTNAYVQFQDCSFDRAVPAGDAITTYPIIGSYEFPVTARPASFGAIRGAIARLDLGQLGTTGDAISVRSWVAETSHPTSSIFRVAEASVIKGVTSNRPTLNAADYGVVYLDTTLDADGKPIWWTGTAWVDATGAAV